MSLFLADPSELYAIADRISRHADAVRSSATVLAAAVMNDHWRGLASDVFSAEARIVVTDMRTCAGRLDDAADALRRHAARVHGVLAELTRRWHDVDKFADTVMHDVGHLVLGGGGLLARMAG